MTSEQKKEFTYRIANANRSQLVVIKYEMIFVYMQEATEAMKQGEWESVKYALSGMEKVVDSFMKCLNFDYDISTQLYPLYRYCMEQFAACRIKKDLQGMAEAKKVLDKLYSSFVALAKNDDSKPLMANSQQLITGVTYGKNSLNDTYSDDANRGYFI